MEIPNSFLIGCLVLGLLIAFALWCFAVVPWWVIPLVAIGTPILIAALFLVAFYALWIACGSH